MSEFVSPSQPVDGLFVSSDTSAALRDMVEISQMRSQAHELANMFGGLHVRPEQNGSHELRARLTAARGLLARWAIMAAHQEFRTIDLAHVTNFDDRRGAWDATRQAEAELAQLSAELQRDGQSDGPIPRHTEAARRRISVDPTLLSMNGLVAVRRKRLVLATRPRRRQFVDVRSRDVTVDTHLEIDKVSEFVLDIAQLRDADAGSADEIEAIVDSGLLTEVTDQRQQLRVPDVIEAAIDRRDPLLTPATTIYYVQRKYNQVQVADRDGSSILV